MFIDPIKRTPLTSMEELKEFSYRTQEKAKPLTYCMNNGQYAFTDDWGIVYVTPYRPELPSILESNGYREDSIYVPFSNGVDEIPEAYLWLKKMADRQCSAETHEMAFQVARQKGLKNVLPTIKGMHVAEVVGCINDEESRILYTPMVMGHLGNGTSRNVGTYIIVSEKTLVICDEYGRTFLVRVPKVINRLVNNLIDAGYTEAAHPEFYVHIYPAKEEKETEKE